MINREDILSWGKIVPWSSYDQIEQDLLISRSLVAIFSQLRRRSNPYQLIKLRKYAKISCRNLLLIYGLAVYNEE